ncbi:MAG TPA: ABC-2 family transporter protein [Kofleriaceae bacterium]|nr:ABC-2 family transporter protein [Kofleriaceae bacterium]
MRSGPSRTLRALPTLLRIGVAETVAYRGEFLVWILTTTQPLIMLGLWTSVAREAPFGGYSSADFVAYFLASLIVRQLTGNWVAWQMSEEVQSGAMAMRLLRPLHPFFAYAASHAAAIPFRSIIALPVALALLASSGASAMTTDPVQLALLVPSLVLAWLITFALMFAIGALAFFLTQTMAIANLYFGLFSLFSGYLMPLTLLPRPIAAMAAWLPFRFMLSAPVELMTRPLGRVQLIELFGGQLAWGAITLALALAIWRAGVRRFEAVGG